MMKLGVPKELLNNERRVAATPASVQKLKKLGYEVLIQSGAGEAAEYADAAYEQAGATIVKDAKSLWQQADFVLKVRAPLESSESGENELELMQEGTHLVSYVWPAQNEDLLKKFAEKKATVFAINCDGGLIPKYTATAKATKDAKRA